MRNTYPASINLTSKDYELIRSEMISKLPIITGGRWSNLNESDPGIALVEVLAAMLDNVYYYQDAAINEAYMPNARQRTAVTKFLRALGYETRNISAARGTVKLGVDSNTFPVFPVTVPAFTTVSGKGVTGQQITFTCMENTILQSVIDKAELPVIQGSLVGDVTNKAVLIAADGQPDQKYLLDYANVDITTITVFANGNASDVWTRVPSFFGSKSDDKHFVVQLNDDLRPVLIFGNGVNGFIPTSGLTLYVRAIRTDGSVGNVGAGAIAVVSSTNSTDSNGNPVTLVVTNDDPVVGGADIESIESAKMNAVGQIYSVKKAVTSEDFAYLMTSLPSVDKAIAWGEQDEKYPNYELLNRVQLSFFSKQYTDFNDERQFAGYNTLRDSIVKPYLAERIPVTTRMVFVNPKLVDIYITLRLGIDTNVYNPQLVISNVIKTLQDYFSFDNVYFGQAVRISLIQRLVNSVQGVAWVQIPRLAKYPVPTFVLNASQPEVVAPDPAPNPPVDIILARNELPIITERSSIFTASVPLEQHIEITKFPDIADQNVVDPATGALGINDVGSFALTVINPDGQSDTLLKGMHIVPNPAYSHITVTYVPSVDTNNAAVGYYNKPSGDTAVYCPKV